MSRSALSSAVLILALAAGMTAMHPAASRADLIKLDLLIRSCTGKSAVTLADCTGYVAGVSDMLEDEHAICPGGAQLKAVREMVVGYLQSHHFAPETHAAGAVSEALRAGYACKKP